MTDRRVALVTGASRGIGRAVAERLAQAGYFVVGTATTQAGAEDISRALGEQGFGVSLRLESSESVAAALSQVEERAGSPAVLVNNAGVTRDNLLLRMSDQEWEDVIATNVSGLFRLCKPVLRAMLRARWGRIVNLSSVVARMGNPGQTNYAASKSAVEGFSRALAQEVGSRGITVNAVAPGFIETDMTAALSDAQNEKMLARIPLGKMGRVEDIAEVVAFLVSDGAAYITGETIHVNGGLYSA